MDADQRQAAVAEALAAHASRWAGISRLTTCRCNEWGPGALPDHRAHVAAVLAALDQPALGADERAALSALVEDDAVEAILTARAHRPTAPAGGADDALLLLREWYQQWEDHPDMPSKMGAALHVRTALFLANLTPIAAAQATS